MPCCAALDSAVVWCACRRDGYGCWLLLCPLTALLPRLLATAGGSRSCGVNLPSSSEQGRYASHCFTLQAAAAAALHLCTPLQVQQAQASNLLDNGQIDGRMTATLPYPAGSFPAQPETFCCLHLHPTQNAGAGSPGIKAARQRADIRPHDSPNATPPPLASHPYALCLLYCRCSKPRRQSC